MPPTKKTRSQYASTVGRRATRAAAAVATLFILAIAANAPASAAGATLAATPYMGWTTFYGLGGRINEQSITSEAASLTSTGLARAGYRIVWLDWGWAWNQRNADGSIYVWGAQWPHGLSWLTAYLHQRGLLAGIYTDAGASGCNDNGQGSLGHYQQDVNSFAAWGFDAIKVDFCGAAQAHLSPKTLYTQFAAAIAANASHRPMIFNVANLWMPQQLDGVNPAWADSAFANYLWAPAIAQSWRTDTDIAFPLDFHFSNVLRNLDADAAHPEAAGPGRWNDPDALGPQIGLTANQAQAQMSMWAILAAPLILGSDPRTLSPQTLAMLENPRVLAVDQDALGKQGTMLTAHGSGQVWVRTLADGGVAVALLNRGSTPLSISTTAVAAGLRANGVYRLQDLWTGQITTSTSASISATVPPTGAALYRVSYTPAPPKPKKPQTAPGRPRVKATRTGAVVTIPAAPRGDTIRVYRLIAGKRVLVFSGSKNVVRLTGLKPGRRYTYTVVYANSAGQSPSRVFVVKTLR